MHRFLTATLLSLCTLSLASLPLMAQAPAPQPTAAHAPSIATDFRVLEMLVKNAICAVNHANITGNYTVLRDLGTETFRQQNSAAKLAKIFAHYHDEHFDLSPVLTSQPQFTRPPAEVQPGRLQLAGYFPTQPRAVRFAITYQRTAAGWGIEEISLDIAPLASVLAPPQTVETSYPPPTYQAAAPHSAQFR